MEGLPSSMTVLLSDDGGALTLKVRSPRPAHLQDPHRQDPTALSA